MYTLTRSITKAIDRSMMNYNFWNQSYKCNLIIIKRPKCLNKTTGFKSAWLLQFTKCTFLHLTMKSWNSFFVCWLVLDLHSTPWKKSVNRNCHNHIVKPWLKYQRLMYIRLWKTKQLEQTREKWLLILCALSCTHNVLQSWSLILFSKDKQKRELAGIQKWLMFFLIKDAPCILYVRDWLFNVSSYE